MEPVKMYCYKAHTYKLKRYRVGDEMDVRRKDVAILRALKRAGFEKPDAGTPETATEGRQAHIEADGVNTAQSDEDAVKASLRAEYKALFGRNAAGRMSIDGLRAAIEEKKGES